MSYSLHAGGAAVGLVCLLALSMSGCGDKDGSSATRASAIVSDEPIGVALTDEECIAFAKEFENAMGSKFGKAVDVLLDFDAMLERATHSIEASPAFRRVL
jgi:hypothetical protein